MSNTNHEENFTHCIYCAGRRKDSSFTDEHIWPRALGGDSCPLVFRTRQVCRSCNNLAGQWVDRAFLRNFFTSSERSKTAREYLDPRKPGILPLIFMGQDMEIPLKEDEVCERWLGPSGESIYHIHEKDEDKWLTLAGGDFFKRKKDPGRVYFYLADKSPYWAFTAILSIVKFFSGVKPRCLTIFEEFDDRIPILQADQLPLSDAEEREIAWINARPKGSQNHAMTLNLGYADRFLAKLALGLGHTILGPAASFSPYAEQLRSMLWSKNFSEREDFKVRGTGPWNDDMFGPIKDYITWPGVWSVFLSQLQKDFGLVVGSPHGRMLSIVLSDNPNIWKSDALSEHSHGVLYLIVPQREKTFGPIPMQGVIAHKLGHLRHPKLSALESFRAEKSSLPPHERPDDDGY